MDHRFGLVDGTPEANGVIAMLNAPTTTFATLDRDAGLDRRAAENLMAYRDGPAGGFATIAEIDAVPWVGPSALQHLFDYARATGWVDQAEFYGCIEGVDFTVARAQATVQLANAASFAVLDEQVPLDRRAAQGLVEGRPFATIEAVAAVPYVGPVALLALQRFATPESPPATLSTAAATEALTTATEGLVHISDIDDPLTVVILPGVRAIEVSTAKDVLPSVYVPRAGEVALADRVVEAVTLARYFDDYTVEDTFWGEDQFAVADSWRRVRAIFEERLSDATVLRLGEYPVGPDVGGAIDIYVLGTSSDGDLVGFRTVSVEP